MDTIWGWYMRGDMWTLYGAGIYDGEVTCGHYMGLVYDGEVTCGHYMGLVYDGEVTCGHYMGLVYDGAGI